MLHADPLMVDIDVTHWRNLQDLVLSSAKEKRRVIVIHENGNVLKLVHSHRMPIRGGVEDVTDAHATARRLYAENSMTTDFVAVFERQAFNEYFARFQATWDPDEDLDDFVHRTYELLDEYPDGIVTFPGEPRHVLGLQWRIGASHQAVVAAVKRFVPPRSTVVFGIFERDALWATLVIGFDGDFKARIITTADMSAIAPATSRQALAEEIVGWVNRVYPPCSIGLFTSVEGARAFLESADKAASLRQLYINGDLIAGPVPPGLDLGCATVG